MTVVTTTRADLIIIGAGLAGAATAGQPPRDRRFALAAHLRPS
jgi:hypothetical protein